jgi:hypothetical protein
MDLSDNPTRDRHGKCKEDVLMKKWMSLFVLLSGLALAAESKAGVSININVPLPGLVIPVSPSLVVVPGTYVYYPPEIDVDIFFYRGYWYRPYRRGWYRAADYNGPWYGITSRRVPRPVYGIPKDYRSSHKRHTRVPCGEVQRNWRNWEKERHWNGDERNEHKEHGRKHEHED